MIAFFAQKDFVSALPSLTVSSGFSPPPSTLRDGLFFGGGFPALQQLGIEAFGIAVVMITVFVISYMTSWLIAAVMNGITTGTSK